MGEQVKLHCIYSCSPLLSLPHYHNVLIIETKYTINVMHLNHLETIPHLPGPWKSCLL